jgi:hypothetical protein
MPTPSPTPLHCHHPSAVLFCFGLPALKPYLPVPRGQQCTRHTARPSPPKPRDDAPLAPGTRRGPPTLPRAQARPTLGAACVPNVTAAATAAGLYHIAHRLPGSASAWLCETAQSCDCTQTPGDPFTACWCCKRIERRRVRAGDCRAPSANGLKKQWSWQRQRIHWLRRGVGTSSAPQLGSATGAQSTRDGGRAAEEARARARASRVAAHVLPDRALPLLRG